MNLQQRIGQDLILSMKARDDRKLGTVRLIKSALKNRQIELGRELDDADAIPVLKTLIKQRHDSVEQYTQAGRKDLADIEVEEIAIIEQYLPPMLSEAEVEKVIDQVISELGAKETKDMGPVMKTVMSRLATSMVDGKLINHMVRSKLSSGRTS